MVARASRLTAEIVESTEVKDRKSFSPGIYVISESFAVNLAPGF
jgi:hypothetical protein